MINSKAVQVLHAVANARELLTEVEIAAIARVTTREACTALHAWCERKLVGFCPGMPLRWGAGPAARTLLCALAIKEPPPTDELKLIAEVDAAIELVSPSRPREPAPTISERRSAARDRLLSVRVEKLMRDDSDESPAGVVHARA